MKLSLNNHFFKWKYKLKIFSIFGGNVLSIEYADDNHLCYCLSDSPELMLPFSSATIHISVNQNNLSDDINNNKQEAVVLPPACAYK